MEMIRKFSGKMFVGQAVYMSLYGKGIGYIYEIDSDCNQGDTEELAGGTGAMSGSVGAMGGGDVKIVFKRGMLSKLPECLLRGGIQYGVTESEPATAAELEQMLAYAKLCQQERDQKEADKKAAFAEAASKVGSQYPHLLPLSEKKDRMSEVAFVAANIRRELKQAFAGIKFSVKSDRNSVDIYWTDGVSREDVNQITSKYKDGSFNGHEDYFEHKDSPFTSVFGGANYISYHRDYSDALVTKICEQFGKEWSYQPTLEQYRRGCIDFKYDREFNEMLRTHSEKPEQPAKPAKARRTTNKPDQGGIGEDAQVKSARDGMTLTAETHTKTNKPLFIVRLDNRLDRESFVAMNTLAKQFKGYWSRFKGGFIFDDMTQAEIFMS